MGYSNAHQQCLRDSDYLTCVRTMDVQPLHSGDAYRCDTACKIVKAK